MSRIFIFQTRIKYRSDQTWDPWGSYILFDFQTLIKEINLFQTEFVRQFVWILSAYSILISNKIEFVHPIYSETFSFFSVDQSDRINLHGSLNFTKYAEY